MRDLKIQQQPKVPTSQTMRFRGIFLEYTNNYEILIIQKNRYMHGRGCSKRHTVGCTEDIAASPVLVVNENLAEVPQIHSPAPSASSSGGRTRRTGLLTVMERPPGKLLYITLSRTLHAHYPPSPRINYISCRIFLSRIFYNMFCCCYIF